MITHVSSLCFNFIIMKFNNTSIYAKGLMIFAWILIKSRFMSNRKNGCRILIIIIVFSQDIGISSSKIGFYYTSQIQKKLKSKSLSWLESALDFFCEIRWNDFRFQFIHFLILYKLIIKGLKFRREWIGGVWL